ncbi:tetratricopeptide repeat protein [Polyangium sp. 6x1]|uniref:tetratricopeptide repeat protein n=1 Tax=Polyangium sp. 6x1 TaxID=3042689 RepID=UPI002482AB8D|nr:tetratricopeptide repeat protein [Polyangium sp. 6x1]MDI1446121.1 hypothetical protein [Polyangium sp. 6x1]
MRALVSALLPLSVLLFACGGGPSASPEPAKAPVVEVGAGPAAPPLPAPGPEEGASEAEEARAAEPVDACIEHLREGRGLPEVAPGPDAALYAEALAAERSGKMNEARKGYLKLIQQYPQSPYIPLVYFAFGELFFREAQKDPSKSALAKQSYMEVVKYPPPANTAWLAATFRLADVHHQNGAGPDALAALKKLEGGAAKEPGAQCAASLAPPGRAKMVVVYADIGQPDKAFEFFRRASGDRGDDRTNALAMVASLAELYLQQQKPGDAVKALLAVNANMYDKAYCRREEALVAKLGTSLDTARRQELGHAHSMHCVPH